MKNNGSTDIVDLTKYYKLILNAAMARFSSTDLMQFQRPAQIRVNVAGKINYCRWYKTMTYLDHDCRLDYHLRMDTEAE